MENEQEAPISQEAETPTTQEAQVPAKREFTDYEKQLYARVKELEGKIELKKSQSPSETSTSKTADVDRLDLVEQKVDLRMAGYDRDEISEIEAVAKAKGITLQAAAELPLIKKGIEALRAEKKSTDATPSPTGKIRTFEGKPVDDVIRDPNATPAQKQAAFEAKLKGSRGANSAQ